MKRKLLFLVTAAIAFFAFQGVSYVEPLSAGNHLFKADLTLAQEVPEPTPSLAIGAGVFVLNSEKTELSYAIAYHDLSGPLAAAHFHGPAGVGGAAGVVRGICGGGGCPDGEALITGVWSGNDAQPLTEDLVQALLDGQIYVNLHTGANPPGEIRGQVVRINQ